MKRPLTTKTSLLVCAAALLATACVDNDYDLSKDIDLTVTAGGKYFTIPASSTEHITLDRIFDLDDNQTLKKAEAGNPYGLAEGDYYLNEKSDEEKESDLKIDATTLKLGRSTEETDELTFVNPGIIGLEDVQTLTKLNTEYQLQNDDVPGQLRSLNWTEFNAPVSIRITFSSPNGVGKLTMKEGLTIKFPGLISLEDKVADFYKAEGNIITITNDKGINASGISIDVNMRRIDLAPDYLNCFTPSADPRDENLKGTINLPLDIQVRGNMGLSAADFPAGVTTAKATFRANITIGDADILRAEGRIDPNFDIEFSPVNFVDVPEFLNDSETMIDLADPQIVLNVSNSSPIGLNVQADLVGLDKDGNPLISDGAVARVSIGQPVDALNPENPGNALYLPAACERKFLLSRTPKTTFNGQNVTNIVVPNLNQLVYKIPEKLGIENIIGRVPQIDYIVELGQTHKIKTSYEFFTPLAFGDKLNFVYKDTLDGFSKDLEDFKINKVEFKFNTVNTIPMVFDVKATPININKAEISNVKVEVTGQIGTGNGEDTGEISVVLTAENGNISNLDGICLELVGKDDPNTAIRPLSTKQTLQIKDVRIVIRDGVTVDLN